MPLHAVSELLGIPAEDREQVLAWTNLITVPLDPHFTPSQAEFEQALDGLWRYGLQLSGLRGTEPDESIMSAIARGHANGVLSDDEVSGYMLALAAAGNETTRNAIAIGLHALLLRPEQMALLRAQGGMPESAVEEILRWASPAIHTVRLAKEDVTLHGETIRAGDRVALLLSSANFDPRQFERPEDFNVDACRQRPCGVRHLGAYLPRPACREARTQDPVRGAAAPGAADRACRQGRVHSRQSGARHSEDADSLRRPRLNTKLGPRLSFAIKTPTPNGDKTVLFLSFNESAFITATAMAVDGGRCLH